MEKKTYIGITIGPIIDTICLTSTPAGLWAASFLFSHISSRLCEELLTRGVDADAFVVPAFRPENGQVKLPEPVGEELRGRGVGFFHDRIIIESDDLETVNETIEKVKKEIAGSFQASLNTAEDLTAYFEDYLQIYAVEFSQAGKKIPFLEISQLLDALELQKSFAPVEKKNRLLELFNNDTPRTGPDDEVYYAKNDKIKRSFLVKDKMAQWMLSYVENEVQDKSVRDIKDIQYIAFGGTGGNSKMKKFKYYAVIQSDGDNMGSILKNFSTINQVHAFSEKCLAYTAAACGHILTFGGVPVYAGGDDLLFLAPVENAAGINIVELIYRIKEEFKKAFEDEIAAYDNATPEQRIELEMKRPAVSFGVAIRYYRFPLYEAFNAAYQLMRYEAKKEDTDKDSLAINLQKNSGQSMGLVIENLSGNPGTEKIFDLVKKYSAGDFLKSVCYQLEKFKELFILAIQQGRFPEVFKNTFDSDGQKKWGNDLDELSKTLQDLNSIRVLEEDNQYGRMIFYTSLLRFAKFFSEEGDEK
jgi:CRISPR-associated protein Cmr2